MRQIVVRLLLCVIGFVFVAPAVAQGVTRTTLEKIRDYRAIYVGHREASVPFSYMVGQDVVGYSIDICRGVVEGIKEAVGDPALKVFMVPVTSSSRFLMLQAGMVDLECGSTSNTKLRQHSVAFSLNTFISGIKGVVRKDSGLQRIADLDGRVVVTTAGTTTERLVRGTLNSRGLSGRFKAARTHSDSLGLVVSKQADVFVVDDALLAGLVANSRDADNLRFLEDNFGYEPYAIAVRRDDPEFKKLVDASIRRVMQSGELERIYNKWFMSPIPPKGTNLQIPMSDLLREQIRNPNDEGT